MLESINNKFEWLLFILSLLFLYYRPYDIIILHKSEIQFEFSIVSLFYYVYVLYLYFQGGLGDIFSGRIIGVDITLCVTCWEEKTVIDFSWENELNGTLIHSLYNMIPQHLWRSLHNINIPWPTDDTFDDGWNWDGNKKRIYSCALNYIWLLPRWSYVVW